MATRRNRKTRKTRKNYKRTKKNYKKIRRGGGACMNAVSKEAISFNELSKLKQDYCGSLSILRHGKCCKQIEEHLNTLQKSKGIIEKDIENKNPLEESKEYSFDDVYTEFPQPRNY